MEILLQFCPILGAKPELRGHLKFRDADALHLSFAEGRGGAKPFLILQDGELLIRHSLEQVVKWTSSVTAAQALEADGTTHQGLRRA